MLTGLPDAGSKATALSGANYAAPPPCVKPSPREAQQRVRACRMREGYGGARNAATAMEKAERL